jgi:hypothetical protein
MPLCNPFISLQLILPQYLGGESNARNCISFISMRLQPIVPQFRRLIIFARFQGIRRFFYSGLILNNLYTYFIQSP